MRRDRPALTSQYLAIQLTGFVLFLLLTTALASTARAGDDPSRFVQRLGDQAAMVMTDPSLTRDQRNAAMQRMLQASFDVDMIGRIVLGRHWRGASEEQRRTYSGLFETYVLAVYTRRLEGYAGERLEVSGARDKGRQGVLVSSRVVRPNGAPIAVVWRLRRGDDGWRVYDLVVEGVSLVMTQRSEFDTVIRRGGGIDSLIVNLRALIDRLERADTA